MSWTVPPPYTPQLPVLLPTYLLRPTDPSTYLSPVFPTTYLPILNLSTSRSSHPSIYLLTICHVFPYSFTNPSTYLPTTSHPPIYTPTHSPTRVSTVNQIQTPFVVSSRIHRLGDPRGLFDLPVCTFSKPSHLSPMRPSP